MSLFLKVLSTVILSILILGIFGISIILSRKEKEYKYVSILMFGVSLSLFIPMVTLWVV